MSGIFISYHHDDTESYARRLFDDLSRRFGANQVFLDLNVVAPGMEIAPTLTNALGMAEVVLVLIGPNWSTRRNSWAQKEVESALATERARVMPVLVGGARMPRAEELPEGLGRLTRYRAFTLSDERWAIDVEGLMDMLEPFVLSPQSSHTQTQGPALADDGHISSTETYSDTTLSDDESPATKVDPTLVSSDQSVDASGTTATHEMSAETATSTASDSQSDRMNFAVRLLADTPSDVDLLGFSDYARAIVDFISSERTAKPLTIGIDAAWGMGKSTLMRMIRDHLDFAPKRPQSWWSRPLGWFRHRSGPERFPTIWFNAWKYDREESLWAALALAIIDDLRSYMTPWQQIKLWFALNRKRTDISVLLWQGLRTFLVWVLLVSFAGLTVLAGILLVLFLTGNGHVATTTWDTLNDMWVVLGVVVSLSGIVPAVRNVFGYLGRALELKVGKYVQNPQYHERIGFLAQFEHDFKAMVTIATQDGRWPLVVFIDDLDRCSPNDTVEIIEAINLFLDGEDCVFILGMDMATVSRSVQAKYAQVAGLLGGEEDLSDSSFGRRFVEKIVQVEFRIPVSGSGLMENFVQRILAGNTQLDDKSGDEQERLNTQEAVRILEAERRSGGLTNLQQERPDAAGSGSRNQRLNQDRVAVQRAREEVDAKNFDDDPIVTAAILNAMPYFQHNPRKIKRFINVLRLQALILYRRNLLVRGAPSIPLVAKCVIISMRWPHLVEALLVSNIPDVLAQADLVSSRLEHSERRYNERLDAYLGDHGDLEDSQMWRIDQAPKWEDLSEAKKNMQANVRDPLVRALVFDPSLTRLLNELNEEERDLLPSFLGMTQVAV